MKRIPVPCRLALLRLLPGALLLFSLAESLFAQTNYQIIRSLGFPRLSTGGNPESWLVEGIDGRLYGTTFAGGSSGMGTVFSVGKDGSDYSLLHTFTGGTNDGGSPAAGLLFGHDGALYGTTTIGGTNAAGLVFKVNTDGTGFQELHAFGSFNGDGGNPYAGLIQGQDNLLYGTTTGGGTNGAGTVYRLNTNGGAYSVVFALGNSPDGAVAPFGGVIQAPDGMLYGTTREGGADGTGTVFRVSTNGTSFKPLHDFASYFVEGAYPPCSLLMGVDGNLYGIANQGGTNGYGTVFTLDTNGANFNVLHNFDIYPDSFYPNGALIQASNGLLYGTASSGGGGNWGSLFEISTNGVTYNVIVSLVGPPGGGEHPQSSLMQASDGLLYGTCQEGGTNQSGTLFSLHDDGSSYNDFFSFDGNGGDANSPEASLLLGRDGALYGTSYFGGSNGLGAIFKVNRDGTAYQLLHSFDNDGVDGYYPEAGLLQADNGMLFGTTYYGGTNESGTVFTLSTNGSDYSVVFSPIFYSQGDDLYGTLIQGLDGALYGTAQSEGTNGEGVVFRIDKNGQNYAALHSFPSSATDGMYPLAGVIQGTDGVLYGTTSSGGSNSEGTVFSVTTNGSQYSILHHFPMDPSDGYNPYASLTQGPDGMLYGTTYEGGTNYEGTIFKIDTNGGNYTILHTCAPGEGQYPYCGLIWAGAGMLLGTAFEGGDFGYGTAFAIGTNGENYSTLHSFNGSPGDGSYPQGGLVLGNDGGAYGTTTQGGLLGSGTVFKLSSDAEFAAIQYSSRTGAVLTVTSLPGQIFHIQATTNLAKPAWGIVASNLVGASGLSQFIDSDATNHSTKFYRTTTP
jgi:uncharacterized repeat protein (TIGR03803 family)